MSSYGSPGRGGASFSSRITNFADIADISIDHLQFEDGPATPAQSAASAQRQGPPAPSRYSAYIPSSNTPSSTTPSLGVPQPHYTSTNGAYVKASDSSVSLQSQFDAQGRPLKGRESLVSLQSSYDPPTPPLQSEPYSSAGPTRHANTASWVGGHQSQGYEPISGPTPATPPSRSRSRGSRAGGRGRYSLAFTGQHETIPEEHDMAILPAAAPMAQNGGYNTVPTHDDADFAFHPASTLGPMSLQDQSFVKKLQEEEARGHLTGGLGAGWKTEDRILGSELLSSPGGLQRSLTRRFTNRQSRGRDEVLRDIGQDEANRKGKVIEVVMDDHAGVDISAMVGPEGMSGSDEGGSTTKPPTKAAQVFYPQPNWKPFSMRWPYLSLLIILSVGLAVLQEFVYQKSKSQPLVTFKTPDEISPLAYFGIKFVPTIVAVTYGVLWQVTDFEVKRLEAFYQLSKPGGAVAEESLCVDYVTSVNMLRPLRALSLRHYAVSASSLGAVIAISLVPTFGAASIQLTPGRDTRVENPDMEKHIIVDAVWSRLLTSTLIVCAISASVLFFLLQTRRSGLLSDVKGIAGLASMAVVSHILMDFKDMDTATHEDIHNRLRYRRYILRNSALAPDDETPSSSQQRADDARSSPHTHTHLSENPHPLMLTAPGFVTYAVGVALFTGFVTAVFFTEATVVTDRAPWVITALAVCVKLGWSTLDTDVRMMEPYYILSRRHAPARTLSLDYTALAFGYMPWRAFRNGHTLMGLVGAGSVAAEILTVMLTSLATVDGRDFVTEASAGASASDLDGINSGQETVVSFFGTLGLALLILVYMMAVGAVVFARRRHAFLPRQPNTIASVLAYMHQSRMLYDFVGTARLSGAEMAGRMDRLGKTYGLGWFQGRDGRSHCGVDEEELAGGYKHGARLGEMNTPWATQWSVF